jgi:thiol-disulfide isomerase/thioredoxin/outer membrane lipoprotein-sorting protein
MKTVGFLAFLFAVAAASIPSAPAQNSQQVTRLPEGGTRPLVSIFIPPLLNAPFTATLNADALTLLKQAAQRYADAKTYRIEAIEESNTTTELSREWQESLTTAIQGPGNRFRYEVRSADGSSIRISDGKTEWIYHIEDNAYIQHPVSAEGPAVAHALMPADLVEFHAIKLRETLAGFAGDFQSAQLLADETLTLNGRQVSCYVVKVRNQDLAKASKSGVSYEKTVWIDKDNTLIRKIVTHERSLRMMSPSISQDIDTTELYPVVELNVQIPDDVFTFAPPQTASLLEKFRDPFNFGGEDLTGKPAPSLTFKSTDGKEISLASLRGKPVLVDFWATWCLPCVASMPQMAQIYQQTKANGLVFLGVDEDHDAKTAADFLAKRQESWPNFHDSGDIAKAFKESGLPYTVLIDQQGKIVFCKTGYSNDSLSDLRAAIAKLGPEFSSVTQSP